MGNLIEFPSYIYEKEKNLEKKANDLFELEQELAYKAYSLEVETSRLRLGTSHKKARAISMFAAGAIFSLLIVAFAIMIYT
jgi:hypothetical protein